MVADIPVLEWSSATGHATLKKIRSEISLVSAGKLIPAIPDYSDVDFVDVPVDLAEYLVDLWCGEYLDPVLSALSDDLMHFAGQDFGRSGDLTVIWVVAEQKNLNVTTPFTIELRDAPYRVQQQILKYTINHLPNFSGFAPDARGNGSQIAEFARQEWGPELVEQVMLTEGWYRENMPRMKTHLEDNTLTLPKSANIKDDLRAIRVIRGIPRIPEGKTGKKGQQRHADSAIALALALYAQANMGNVEPWECETAGERKSTKMIQGF